jgi:transposase
MGRSRGGLTTKIHALVDADGLPIALKLTDGQAHDGRAAWDMLGSLAAGNILLADRAYDSDALRQTLAERGAWANVKPMPNRRNVPAFSSFLTATATSSSASLTSSSTSGPSQPAMTKHRKTTSHPSSSPQ